MQTRTGNCNLKIDMWTPLSRDHLEHNKKDVSAVTTWNSKIPIGEFTLIVPIEDVEPIPNLTLAFPDFDLSNFISD